MQLLSAFVTALIIYQTLADIEIANIEGVFEMEPPTVEVPEVLPGLLYPRESESREVLKLDNIHTEKKN